MFSARVPPGLSGRSAAGAVVPWLPFTAPVATIGVGPDTHEGEFVVADRGQGRGHSAALPPTGAVADRFHRPPKTARPTGLGVIVRNGIHERRFTRRGAAAATGPSRHAARRRVSRQPAADPEGRPATRAASGMARATSRRRRSSSTDEQRLSMSCRSTSIPRGSRTRPACT